MPHPAASPASTVASGTRWSCGCGHLPGFAIVNHVGRNRARLPHAGQRLPHR
jgi:hypothetical protein